ncbi:MAG: glycosyltransferase family 2 protein [Thermoleophilia bacterium]
MLLSVVIPAHNEAEGIVPTVRDLSGVLRAADIGHEIVVVDDHSSDGTGDVVTRLSEEIREVRLVTNSASGGFGMAVRAGLEAFRGDAVAVYMADASDSPEDLVMFWRTMEVRGVDCVFGSRFSPGGRVIDYPPLKLRLNRVANTLVRLLFNIRYNDITNAFKLYRREVIAGVSPLLSHHFNLTVEIPLKAIIRGYTYAVVPNSWTNRSHGTSKFQIQEMGSRYAFIVLYCFLERWLSRGDYRRQATGAEVPARVTRGE